MEDSGVAKVWRDLAADNRALLDGIRGGLARRSYSHDELEMLEAEAARYERLASEYEAERVATDRRQAGPNPRGELL